MNLQQIVALSIFLFSGLVIGFIFFSFLIYGLRKKIGRWINSNQNTAEISLIKQQINSTMNNQIKKNVSDVTNQKNRTLNRPYPKRFQVMNESIK